MKTQKTKNILITCLVLTLILFSIFSFLICNNFKVFFNFVTNINLENNKISQTNSSNNALTDQNINNNEDTQDSPQNENSKITNTSTCVSVGEIWNDTTKKFKKNELLQLIKYATNTNITINNLNALKGITINANDMRTYNSSKDILVTLGGLQWTATYFSQDTSGNPILTLWLSNSAQLAGKNVYKASSSTAIPTRMSFDSYGQSTWNSGFSSSNSPGSAYPDNMYGTSYIRAVTLNNGGWYTTSSGGGSGITFAKKSDSVFSPFTNTTSNKISIADYLITPENVSWQKYQSYKQLRLDPTWLYDLANESWNGQTGSFYGNHNYSNKTNYGVWKNDLLWIPSASELGYSNSLIGIWNLSINQRSNPNSWTWSRSLCCSGNDANGVLYTGEGRTANYVSYNQACRPALHLNIIEAINSAFDIWGYTKFDSDNLNLILKYAYGTNTNTTSDSILSSLNSTIGSGAIKSSTIKTNANKVTDKTFINSNSELVIKFGGLSWYATFLTKNTSGQVILTLWLADSGQLFGKGKTGADGNTKYNFYGSGTFNSGSPPYSDGTSAISNNYGNSNIRTNYFSSASATTNTASVFNAYLKTSSNYISMGDFIVSPNGLNMQDAQNLQKTQTAKSTLGFRYNLPNESYSNLINYSNPYKNLSLSASTTNYTAWQNDKLWLPSLSEVGLGSTNTISTNSTASNNLRTGGLWGLSTAQRSNTNKTATWLRSGHITDKNLAYTISADGTDYGYASIDTQNAIRPALHLNLTLACQYAS